MALRLGDQAGRPGVVVRKGDIDAGGVLIVLNAREGLCVLSQIRTADGSSAWMRGTGAAPVDQAAADAYVARQLRFDPVQRYDGKGFVLGKSNFRYDRDANAVGLPSLRRNRLCVR